ncbi:MAG TPA: hypothetical protein VF678_01115, partial [bacterium]
MRGVKVSLDPKPEVTPAPAAPERGPAMNALKHGRHTARNVLPGEDAAEFERRRRLLFHTYRPQTIHEAQL